MLRLLTVFWEFFKIGLFAVGGGPATIPFLIEISEKTGWFTMEEFTYMIAISESTPGPLGVNMATYVGFTTLGTLGGIVSTIGLVTPSIIVIILIAKFLAHFNDNRYVKAVFAGFRPAVTALIAYAVYNVFLVSLFVNNEVTNQMEPAVKTIALAVIMYGLMQLKPLKKLHPAAWLLAAAIIGCIFRF